MHHNHPELMKDVYWNQTVPSALPYTVETGKSDIPNYFKKCPDQDISIFPHKDNISSAGSDQLIILPFFH